MQAFNLMKDSLGIVEDRISYVFENKSLLVLAFVHRSFVNEYRHGELEHNERLEFLGDSVLGLVVANYLYERLPQSAEGPLSQLRSRLVDANSCAMYLQKLNVAEFILLGRGERISEGKAKTSILSDVFEAIMGAIYLDQGLAQVSSFFLGHFQDQLEKVINSPPCNYKAQLQDYSQKYYQKPPFYKIVYEVGPDHAKIFHVQVCIDGQPIGVGEGSSKKEAEQKAAFDALTKMSISND